MCTHVYNFGGSLVHECTISEDPLYTCVQEDPLYTCVHGGPLGHQTTPFRMSHVYRTHVYKNSLVARVTIQDESQFRRIPCTHVYNFGGPPVHMCTISEDPCTHVYNFGGPPVHMCTISEDPFSAARGRHLTDYMKWRTLTTCTLSIEHSPIPLPSDIQFHKKS